MINAKKLWIEVQENQRKLRSCKSHNFGEVLGSKIAAPRPCIECKNCKGTMGVHDIYIYTLGYKAAGGNPDDVAKYVDGTSV